LLLPFDATKLIIAVMAIIKIKIFIFRSYNFQDFSSKFYATLKNGSRLICFPFSESIKIQNFQR